jgi:hypothetical protein
MNIFRSTRVAIRPRPYGVFSVFMDPGLRRDDGFSDPKFDPY